jgi:hypothetical protein
MGNEISAHLCVLSCPGICFAGGKFEQELCGLTSVRA